MLTSTLSNTTVVAGSSAISCDLDGEAVILHAESGTYFGLNTIGAEIWNLIQQQRTVGEICEHLLGQYEVGSEQCEAEVMSLLRRLEEEGLARMTTDAIDTETVRS
jgi:hypothetical protein